MTAELEAFGRLVAVHYPAVTAVAFAATRDLALSEDIAQDTFIAAWDARATVRDLSRVRAWLCGIARNQSRNALRRRRREISFDELEIIDDRPSADEATVTRETIREVCAALANVPIAYREPLVLFYWEDQSIARVASTLGITEQAAQKRISRGRAYLKDGLTAQLEQVGTHRRSVTTVAAAVVAILTARASAGSSTIAPVVGKSAFAAFHPIATSLGLVGLGACFIVAIVTLSDEPRIACPEPAIVRAEPASVATPVDRTTRHLSNQIKRREFEDLALAANAVKLEERVARLERTAPMQAQPRSVPTPAHTRTASVEQTVVAPPVVAATVERPTEPKTTSCDEVLCVLTRFEGACCQALKVTLPVEFDGHLYKYDLSASSTPHPAPRRVRTDDPPEPKPDTCDGSMTGDDQAACLLYGFKGACCLAYKRTLPMGPHWIGYDDDPSVPLIRLKP